MFVNLPCVCDGWDLREGGRESWGPGKFNRGLAMIDGFP